MEASSARKKILIPGWVGMACVWFGTHCGPGTASGNQGYQYFTKYGLWSLIVPILSMALLGIAVYYAIEFSRLTGATDFKDFANKLFHPYHKIFANLFEFSFVGTVGLSGGACVVTASNIFHDFFGAPVWLGVVAIVVVTIVFSIFGARLVSSVSSVMSLIIFASILTLIFAGISYNGGFNASFAGRSFSDANGGSALWQGVLYAGFQSTGVYGGCIAVVSGIRNKSDSKKAVALGIILNAGFLVLVSAMLLGFPEAMTATLPNYEVAKTVGIPALLACYVTVVFLACATNTISFGNALMGRYGRFFKMENKTMVKLIICVLMLVYMFAFSLLGLNKIVGVGFKYLGYFCIVTLLLPTIIVGPRKLKKMRESGELAN